MQYYDRDQKKLTTVTPETPLPVIFVGGGDGGGGSDVPLSSDIDSDSTTTAATSLAVKRVNDKVDNKADKVHQHNDLYYQKSEIDSNMDALASSLQNESYKLKAKADDVPDYLVNKVDNVTLSVEGNELKVKGVDGLTLTPEQVSTLLSGADSNLQNQINDMRVILEAVSAGMTYIGKFESFVDLQNVTNKDNGDFAVVLVDETRGGARSIYVFNNSLGVWDYITGAFEFKDSFAALTDTPANYTGHDGKIVKVDEANKKLIFANMDYSDITNKPDSTKTQIDGAVQKAHEHSNLALLETYNQTNSALSDAVNKRHTHSNKAALDRFGIDTQGRITIDGVPYIPASSVKQRLYARRTGTEQTLTAGTDCIFNTKYGGDLPYNASTGVFTLEAGKTYRIMVTASMNTTGYVILRVVDATTNAVVPDGSQAIWMDVNVSTTSWHESSAGPLLAYITPTTTGGYKIRATSVSGTSSLRSSYGALEVQEV